MKRSLAVSLVALLLAAPAVGPVVTPVVLGDDKTPPLAKEKEITLEGGAYFDYVTTDPDGGRILVAHAPKIEVIDAKTSAKVGEVPNVDGAHGAIIVTEAKKGFATAGRKNRLMVFDAATYKILKEVETGENPDGLLYVEGAKEVWTFNGKTQNASCIDVASLEVKATIALGGKPEAAVEDTAKGLVYVNLEDKNAIVAVDVKKHSVAGTHAIEGGEGPSGLAFDAKNGLLFAACSDSKKLVVVSTADWKKVAAFDIGEHCDGAAFDAEKGLVYASTRDGVNVVHVTDAKTQEALGTLECKGGKTCAVDPKTHKLYVTSGPKRGEKGDVKVVVFAPK